MAGEAAAARPGAWPAWLVGLGERAWTHRALVAVLGLFAVAATVVPTMAPVATTDDWGYTRSVEILLNEGRLTILPAVAATAVFQVVWGALFALVFGLELGVMRLSTVVAVGIGAVALYGLCRELGATRERAALGAAVYLFHPLSFALAFTFMTDPHFTAWLTVATYFYARGVGTGPDRNRALLFGSLAATAAFLIRQQGALIPLAVAGFLVVGGWVRPNRAGAAMLLRVGAVPAVGIAVYYLWLRFVHGIAGVQEGFSREAVDAGFGGTWELVRSLTPIEAMYVGFFALPLVIGVLPALPRAARTIFGPAALLFAGWLAVLAAGVTFLTTQGDRMPYVPQFVGAGGLGPPDVAGSRPRLFDQPVFDVLTVVCFVAAAALGLILCRAVGRPATAGRVRAGVVGAIALGQVVGILPPSYHYLDRSLSLDRYLLPLLPLGIALTLGALADLRVVRPLAWAAVAVFAVFSTVAMRDYLVFMSAVWSLARDANAAGIGETCLDAGAAWDGYHLYTDGWEQGITVPRSPAPRRWWLSFYGKPSTARLVVAGRPQAGYQVVWERRYSSWLPNEPPVLYLLERDDGRPSIWRGPRVGGGAGGTEGDGERWTTGETVVC